MVYYVKTITAGLQISRTSNGNSECVDNLLFEILSSVNFDCSL